MCKIPSNLSLRLDQYRLIEIRGLDAEKYLQGQLTCDVAKLESGEQTLTCHCDPKGKMSSLFRLYRHNAEHFSIIIRQELLPEALVQLRKYAVFSKVTFTEQATPIFGTTSHELFAKYAEELTACKITETPARYLLWHEKGEITLETNGESALWDFIDIQQGVPILHATNQFELIPQATNLQQIEQAISFTKGCYIGQETIARAKYRGANKRAMFTLVSNNKPQDLPEIGEPIEMQLGEHWKATGVILSRISYDGRLWLQVVMNKELEPGTHFRFGNTFLTLFPLPYQLDEN